jgi:hypothetical protein
MTMTRIVLVTPPPQRHTRTTAAARVPTMAAMPPWRRQPFLAARSAAQRYRPIRCCAALTAATALAAAAVAAQQGQQAMIWMSWRAS